MSARVLSLVVVTVAAASALSGRAAAALDDEAPDEAPAAAPADGGDEAFFTTYAPAPVDAPALRLPVQPTRLYVDTTLAFSDDLSALPYIAGSGRNLRFAVGGAWRWRRLTFTGEVPFTQVTTLTVTAIPGGMPIPEDVHQTAVSFGDVRLGVDATDRWFPSQSMWGGFGLRTRLATHTTRFQFHLIDGSLASYSFPYYFHIEPTAILGGKVGRLTWVVNQGALILMGPDGKFGDLYFHEPTLVFWDAHYAVSYAPLDVLAASFEVATDFQLNHVSGLDFQKINDVRSVWIAPALQLHLAGTRVDLVGRFGVTRFGRGADLLGVLEYAGARSYTIRVSRTF